jgi:hypothetical protein
VWNTPAGERVVTGHEGSLFVQAAAALGDLLAECDADLDWQTGVDPFDRHAAPVRIALLAEVVRAMTDAAVPAPEPNAANEAAVYAVFRFLHDEIVSEIDTEGTDEVGQAGPDSGSPVPGGDPFFWRRLTLSACVEAGDLAGGLTPDCDDAGEWEARLEGLADRVLWDRDWELEDLTDLPPRQARRLRRRLGIDDVYFMALPDDPDGRRLQEAIDFLRRAASERHGSEGALRKEE